MVLRVFDDKLNCMKSSVLLGLISTVAIQGCNGDWMDYSPMDMYNAGVTYDESLATKHLAVAAATISSDKLDKSVTLNRMQEMVETIVAEHPDVQTMYRRFANSAHISAASREPFG